MTETLERSPGLADPVGAGTEEPTSANAANSAAPSPAGATGEAERSGKGRRKPLEPKRSARFDRAFEPTSKHPVFDLELRLLTEPASKVFELTHESSKTTYFFLQDVLPNMSRNDPSVLDSVMEYVDGKFVEIEGEMNGARERLLAIQKDANAKTARRYLHAEMITVQIYAPLHERFLSLVVQMDELMQLVDCVWFARRVNDRQRAELINQWRNRLVRFAREVHTLKDRALSHANKTRETKRSKDEERAARAAAKLQKGRVKDAATELASVKAVRGSDAADLEKGLPSAA